MKVEDEIKQINEIINKLDVIQDDEWQRKEGETEEEYNNRIEAIEEELEEELLDYISNSLLAEQEINEEEAIKEAQEKIKSDYELFNDAFIKDENGMITLKSEEELASLGYATPEEVEKLKEIEENINAPESYINKIKESIHASKDIDAEIDRKMELAKSIIATKKRGETLPSRLNPSMEKDKFEKAMEYIANTTTLRKISIIQNEYINNNYIAERRYNNVIKNNINNIVARSNLSSKTPTTATTLQTVTPASSTIMPQIITQKIPKRKSIVYSNLEKKLDKNNDLTKQKIKARTELKSIFKNFEDKELSKEELEELDSKIKSIKKKYPNTITDKTLDKLYDTFKVKLPTVKIEQQHNNIDITLAALAMGKVIGETIGNIKPKGEEVIENIAQQQKKKVDEEIAAESKAVAPKVEISKEELMEALKKIEAHSTEYIHIKGINLLIINKLICYLKDNDDPEIQERLNKEIAKLQTDRHKNTDKLYIYNPNYTNIQTLKYMYDTYRDGVKSTDGSRKIIPINPNAASYYLYLANNAAQDINSKGNETDKKEIKDEFERKKEETCYRYFEFLKEKYNIDGLSGIERLKVEPDFMKELKQSQYLSDKTEYLEIAILKEFLSRIGDDKHKRELINKVQHIETRIGNGERVDSRTLELIGDMYYHGFKDASGEDIIVQDKRKASKIYEQIINKKGRTAKAEIYSNLIEIYSDNTTPLYDRIKADKLLEEATKNGILIKEKDKKNKNEETSTYVCSDLHGEYPAYQAIISQLKEKDKLYVLGDVIDRGPDGIKILQDIMKRKEKGQVEFLIGNHELMMIQSLFLGDENQKQIWISKDNEGQVTREAFEKLSPTEQCSIREFLLDSYVYKNINVNSKNVHLVHAKAVQDIEDNSNKTVREMLATGKEKLLSEAVWMRDKDGKSPHKESAKPNVFTVIGHSPTDNDMIEYKDGYLDIDCGAAKSILYPNRSVSLVNLTKGIVKYFNVDRERKKENNKQQGK